MVSVGFLPSAYAGAITLPSVDFPCRGGVMMASLWIFPVSRHSRFSMMSAWHGSTSNDGMTTWAKRPSDRRVRDKRSEFERFKVPSPICGPLHKTLHKMRQQSPTKPTVADYRTPNLLTLRVPVVEWPPVTAEVASSSLVVPAILFKHLRKVRLPGVGTKRNNKNIHFPPPATAVCVCSGKIILTTLLCASLFAGVKAWV